MAHQQTREWRTRWTVDLKKREAIHDATRLIVRFTQEDNGQWVGVSQNPEDVFDALSMATDKAGSAFMRLMREAHDIYLESYSRAAQPETSVLTSRVSTA